MKPLLFFLLCCAFLMVPSELWAQGCSMCTKTAAGLGSEASKGLNRGIVYLALLPLGIISTIGIIWYRRQGHSRS